MSNPPDESAVAPKGSPPQTTQALSYVLKEKAALYAAYMPYLKGGGIFIPTAKAYRMGDDVLVLLSLMNEPEKIPVAGKVVWITPEGASGNKAQGVGVQFFENKSGAAARNKIDTLLAGSKTSRPTHTL